jgi:GNAT superfamily N-acetyltransferase
LAVEVTVEIRLARLDDDVGTYAALGREAQGWLQSRGLEQYVPAAHDAYATTIRSRVESGTLCAVWSDDAAVGFFNIDTAPSPWWPADGVPALYLAGMVVSRAARGRDVGGSILRWCIGEAARRGCECVRLDCHAGNPWLCGYYESHGFVLRGRVEQHPGYDGCLYELAVTPGVVRTDASRGSTHVAPPQSLT